MKTVLMAAATLAIATLPLTASAYPHDAPGGGHAYASGGFGGFHGAPGGYHGGHGYYGGYGAGAFGLGLAFGLSAADAPYYDYYPGYYAYAYDAWSDEDYGDNEDYGRAPPPRATEGDDSAAPPSEGCGQWVWHADLGKYLWADTPCASSAP